MNIIKTKKGFIFNGVEFNTVSAVMAINMIAKDRYNMSNLSDVYQQINNVLKHYQDNPEDYSYYQAKEIKELKQLQQVIEWELK